MQMQNSFAAGAGVGTGWVGAERKQECESAKCERVELSFIHFL